MSEKCAGCAGPTSNEKLAESQEDHYQNSTVFKSGAVEASLKSPSLSLKELRRLTTSYFHYIDSSLRKFNVVESLESAMSPL